MEKEEGKQIQKDQGGQEQKRKGRSRKKRRILRTALLMMLSLLLLGSGIVYLIVKPEYEAYKAVAYEKLAGMSRSDFSMRSDTEIFDKDGNRIGLINAGHYEYVPIADISEAIQDAYIAQEDRRFLSHHGVDWIATARAGIKLILNGGKITQGGSTITQQVIKNTFLTQDRTFSRKIIEILMAPQIEKKYTKADIMEFYCNTNYYGNRCYGVQAASRYYFGKPASELSVPEAATLAGISNSPSRYDPVRHPEEAKKKRDRVLASMRKVGSITSQEYESYIAAPLVIVQDTQEGTDEDYLTSYALHCAALTLMKLEGFSFQYLFADQAEYDAYMVSYQEAYMDRASELRGGGYRIDTTLDQNLQNILQEEVDRGLSGFTELQENGKYALQGAAVVVDNETGYVRAIVGGRGSDDSLNRAYNAAIQPGSCIKPLLDYGPAFDTGEYYPARMVEDHKWENGPKNSDGQYRGNVTVRYALNRSLNTVAWQVLEDVGIPYGMSYLGKMQFQKLSPVDLAAPAVSIGGFTNGVRVVDMAKGYATLASGGIYSDHTCIAGITHEELGDLTAGLQEQRTQVYRDDTAFMITDILKGSFTEGTAAGLSLSGGMSCAGKTGTTNDSKATWFCGYTPYYTAAVWVGYDMPRAMPGVYGATYAGKIWQQAMNRIHEGLPEADFQAPPTVAERTEETTGITDWRSVTDEERAAQSLHEKEQAREQEALFALLEEYEGKPIERLEDVDAVEQTYQELMDRASLLDDSPERKDILERTQKRKEEQDAVIGGLGDTLTRWKEQKKAEEERLQKIRESEAAEQREKEAEEVNRTAVQNAIDAIYGEKYRSAHLTELVDAAIDQLSLVSGYPDEGTFSADLDQAISYANLLPSEEEWQRQEEARKAAEAAAEASAKRNTERKQEMLSGRYERETETTGPKGSQTGPGAFLP